ncbi:hybrid sensor histidine kinase/response regulator transcription factor [Sinomicrobium pectinilyticum]|uniref:hybrid sensor histidine kinase/response regulator transcription factor n=1 Tax=Sinomicrobium pectinilyticum TaxID=1084421 RepID=UPI001F0CA525|nr:hybrid sensor histidine kinase/response regulator transcription factor [Sinomicrobium pectinilyticum]
MKFENLSTTEGLSSSTCTEIFQDKDGFLWFGTIDGLNKYDGYTFTVYRPELNDRNSISGNRITSITEDSRGRLWIGTSNGLNVLDKHTEKFTRINFSSGESVRAGAVDVINTLFYDDTANTLWIGTKNGLLRLLLDKIGESSLKTPPFTLYMHIAGLPRSIDDNNITSILKDRNGNIWIGTSGAHLNRYVPASEGEGKREGKTDGFERVAMDIPRSYGLDHMPKSILEDRDGDFWIGNNLSGLVMWDREKGVFEQKQYTSEGNIPIFDMFRDNKGMIWIATDGYGLYLLDKEKDTVYHITHNPSDPFSLPNDQPSKILEDKDGTLWIASYNKGVSKLVLSKSAFGHYFFQPGNPNSLGAKIAQSVIQTRNGKIWIGTDGGGLSAFDESTGKFRHYRHQKGEPSSLSSNKVVYLAEGHEGALWVCTWDGGLNKFDPRTGKAVHYKHLLSDPYSIGQNTVWCAVEDSRKRLWAGTQTAGLNLFDPVSGKFYTYRHDPGKDYSIASDFVFHLHLDSGKRLLVGTSSGLSVLYPEDYLTENIPYDLKFREIEEEVIKGNRVNHIAEDRHGNIWLGTDLGLHKLNKKLQWLKSYSTHDGLPNNLVVGIQEDDTGNLWITTKSGLSRLNPETGEFKNFNTHDGLQGMEFQSKSIARTRDGRILAGGINGFNIFHPEDMNTGADTVRPLLTGFRLFNRSVKSKDTINGRVLFEKPVSKTKTIRLRYNEDHISLGFVALHYQNPERVRYAYTMEGLDKSWIYPGANTTANYSNLAAGDYTFKVKATVNDSWDNAPVSRLKLSVLPPPWKTWWAFVLYGIMAIFLFGLGMRYYTRMVREEKEHELDQMKLRFFINVSHEFRTPLTLILNPLDKILSSYDNPEEVKASAQTIRRSARRLLNLTNQLLDFRKMEQGKSPLETVRGDMVQFCRDIFSLFADLAEMKAIDFRFESGEEELIGWFDPDKVEKIITNLLSNALKFTDSGGSVTLEVSGISWSYNRSVMFSRFFKGAKKKKSDGVSIKVKDTGIGFRKNHLKEVFTRFFHANQTGTGTGIGLNFTRSLVEIHGGEILVSSEYGKGTVFTVKLPVDSRPNALKNGDIPLKNYIFDSDTVKSAEYEIAVSESLEKSREKKTADSAPGGKKQVVLIVEDNRELRSLLKNELKTGFKIKEAANGAEGLKKTKKHFPDLIISDVMMPEMSGFELCRTIKSDIEICHTPVILLTARSLEEDRVAGYNTGADAYLPKPFHMDVLKARIRNLLENRKKLREKFVSVVGVGSPGELVTNSLDEMFLDKVTKIVMENIENPGFEMGTLLKETAMSRSHFYRKINTLTGQNPSGFIRTIRLKYASEQLLKRCFSVKEVAYMSGFNSSAYFSKTFREFFGQSPNAFMESAKEAPVSRAEEQVKT